MLKFLTDSAKKMQLIDTYKLAEYMTLDLGAISDLVSFERNEYLVTAGKNNCVFFSQRQTLVGEASSLFGKPPAFHVKAMSDVLCIAINLNRYRTDLLNDLTFVRNVCELLASKINTDGRYSYTLLDPLEVRLAQFILL